MSNNFCNFARKIAESKTYRPDHDVKLVRWLQQRKKVVT